jgi:pyruvate kinase
MDLAGPKIRTADIVVTSAKGNVKDFIKVQEGDPLTLTKRKSKGKRALRDAEDKIITPAKVGVLLPQIIDDIEVGQPVFFDDGTIEAIVVAKKAHEAELRIQKAHKTKIKAHKGINLPETKLNLPSLTERDIELLPFVVQHADIVGYSFVRNAGDVRKLYQELDKLGNKDLGVVFKIENREAVENLPLILFQAMQRRKIGVMIARGDLAVEIGYERISEAQNDILWLCEAAHVPVIWATQVLENLAKTGLATRAEVSDAAISAKAECVMLNKGPHIVEAVRTLNNILVKMEGHYFKKKPTMRPLLIAEKSLDKLEKSFS